MTAAVYAGLTTFVADASELEVLRQAMPTLPGWGEWLDELPEVPGVGGLFDLPNDPALWPCPLCEAKPGKPCVGTLQDTGRLHVGRGFRIAPTHPGSDETTGDELDDVEDLVDGCVPTVESGPGCVFRGRCLGCGHRTCIVDSEQDAVERIHDHTHEGWRDIRPVRPWPRGTDSTPKRTEKLRADWLAEHADVFPDGWFENGGPIRTLRGPGTDRTGTRSVPGYAPHGGYDIAVAESTSTALEPVDQAGDVEETPAAGEDLWSGMEHWLFHEDGDLTKEQAQAVTAKARAYSSELYRILGRAHDRRVWVALGHESWSSYVADEFDIARSRAYQLVAQYQANEALSATSAVYPDAELDEMSEAQARPLGSLRTDAHAVRKIWERAKQMSGGLPPTMATMADAVAWYRGQLSITDDTPPPSTSDVEPEDEELDPVVPVEPVVEGDWEDVPDETPAQRELVRAWERFLNGLETYRENPCDATERVALASRRVVARAFAVLAPDPVWAARSARRIQAAFYAELDVNGPIDTVKNGSADLRRFDQFRVDLLAVIDPNDLLPAVLVEAIEQRDAVSFNRRTGKAKDDVRFPRLHVEDLLDMWVPPALAGDDDDEVLRGELVDRGDTEVPDEQAAPPAAGSPDCDGEDLSGAESSPSPSSARIKPDDVAQLHGEGPDKVTDAVAAAVDVGLRSTRLDDLDLAAQWLRATASFVESRKADLARRETLRSV